MSQNLGKYNNSNEMKTRLSHYASHVQWEIFYGHCLIGQVNNTLTSLLSFTFSKNMKKRPMGKYKREKS